MTAHLYHHKIFFADTDQAAVVHHSNYLRYFEAARIQLLADLGVPYKTMQAKKIGLAPVDIQTQYLHPLRLEDEYRVETRLVTLKKASVVFDQRVFCGEQLCCKAQIKLANLDEAVFKVVPIDSELRDAILGFFNA